MNERAVWNKSCIYRLDEKTATILDSYGEIFDLVTILTMSVLRCL